MSSDSGWIDKVAGCARAMSHEVEDAYRRNLKASNLHMPKFLEEKTGNQMRMEQHNLFIEALIGTFVWVLTQGGKFVDPELETNVIELIRARFALYREDVIAGRKPRLINGGENRGH